MKLPVFVDLAFACVLAIAVLESVAFLPLFVYYLISAFCCGWEED